MAAGAGRGRPGAEDAGLPAGLLNVVITDIAEIDDANRLGVDLDQLGERVLETPRDRDGATDRHVEV
ncbi:hypothetical protein AB0R12_31235, partial [Streptomyces niveus]|uniref:hypothetical protein n=1 Tax=Streptomyces niveus TaxID=193462 RepID=UPI003414BA0E